MAPLPNIVVVGGSYVGVNTAAQLATALHERFRVVLIEKNSHFHHLFAFPRFAVATGVETHKAFIPYVPGAFLGCPPGSGTVVQAQAVGLTKSAVQLDREVSLGDEVMSSIPYSYLVLATGTKYTPPSTLPNTAKPDNVSYLQKHVQKVIRSPNIVIIGGGAVGVQMATDIKELYPEKSVTLVHSRGTVMNRFHPALHEIIEKRCTELGVEMRLGSRVKLPVGGYPSDGRMFEVELEDGSRILSDFAIVSTGQTPQSALLRSLAPSSINDNGFVRMRKTLQIDDPDLPHVFAVGDVADTGAHKAARPGTAQATVVKDNILHLLQNEELENYDSTDPAGIHMTLGITQNVIFRNPASIDGQWKGEPIIKFKDDGQPDMNIDGVWKRRGGGVDASL